MSVIIDMDKPDECYGCPLCDGVRCELHDEWYDNWPEEYAHCPLRPAPERERWIPVAERLPKDGADILAYTENGENARIVPANYDRGIWYDCCFNRVAENITHWMPLPEPPKEE